MLLSVCIKLGSIGNGKISIANRVPSDRLIVLVLVRGYGDERHARIDEVERNKKERSI